MHNSPLMAIGNTPSLPLTIKISYSDIEEELKYWESSVVCYFLRANPPIHVNEGFVKRICKADEIDKIGSVAKRIYRVHMKSVEGVSNACASNGIIFDKKPFVVRPWSKNMSYKKENLDTILVWVRFPGLAMHYWGERSLRMIASMLGKVIRVDNATLNKDRMQYARVLVEMNMKGQM